MVKQRINISIDEDIASEIRQKAIAKYGSLRAMSLYIEDLVRKDTNKNQNIKVPKVVHDEVKKTRKEELIEYCQECEHLIEYTEIYKDSGIEVLKPDPNPDIVIPEGVELKWVDEYCQECKIMEANIKYVIENNGYQKIKELVVDQTLSQEIGYCIIQHYKKDIKLQEQACDKYPVEKIREIGLEFWEKACDKYSVQHAIKQDKKRKEEVRKETSQILEKNIKIIESGACILATPQVEMYCEDCHLGFTVFVGYNIKVCPYCSGININIDDPT